MLWRILVAIIAAVFIGGSPALAGEKVQFTKEEAEFLAYMAKQDKQFALLKAGLVIAGADFPTSPTDLVDILAKKVVDVAFDAPQVETALKQLDSIQCSKSIEQVQLFVLGKHPEVKGMASQKNRKFFEALTKCYESKAKK